MNLDTPIEENAYKLAAHHYLASDHTSWSARRIRQAILATEDDVDALADQKRLVLWGPIEQWMESEAHPMDDPYHLLDDLIETLALDFIKFTLENPTQP